MVKGITLKLKKNNLQNNVVISFNSYVNAYYVENTFILYY